VDAHEIFVDISGEESLATVALYIIAKQGIC
jgi:hypothetical protein